MAQIDPNDQWTWATFEPEPTEREKALYDTFCHEYLVDRSATLAASRCGFQGQFAKEYGTVLFQKSYVQRRLADLQRQRSDPKLVKDFDSVNTMARLRAILNDETQKASSRVSAAAELNRMHGLHAPTKVNVNANTKSGVMVIPMTTLDDWEKMAGSQQAKLMEESKVD